MCAAFWLQLVFGDGIVASCWSVPVHLMPGRGDVVASSKPLPLAHQATWDAEIGKCLVLPSLERAELEHSRCHGATGPLFSCSGRSVTCEPWTLSVQNILF